MIFFETTGEILLFSRSNTVLPHHAQAFSSDVEKDSVVETKDVLFLWKFYVALLGYYRLMGFEGTECPKSKTELLA